MDLHERITDADADAVADTNFLWNRWMRGSPMPMPTLVYWNDEGGADADAGKAAILCRPPWTFGRVSSHGWGKSGSTYVLGHFKVAKCIIK